MTNSLAVEYVLKGALEGVLIPPPAVPPERKDNLWKETCFELFMAGTKSERYWEFNLSPAGHWNVYRFNSYRQGMQEEPSIRLPRFSLRREEKAFRLSLEFDTGTILSAGDSLEVGISAVIEHQGGALTYWALTHALPHPDFHCRRGFCMIL